MSNIKSSFPHFIKTTNKPCLIMGIVNLHPNSFSPVGRHTDPSEAADYALSLLDQGADIIDLGAEPTNPKLGSLAPSENGKEAALLKKVSQLILKQHPKAMISFDTSDPRAISEAGHCGVHMINDVRALRRPGALEAFAKTSLSVCLMHMAYPDGLISVERQVSCSVESITGFLKERIKACQEAGIALERILVDPGMGGGSFGKTPVEDLMILKHLESFHDLQAPICLGLSRKTFMQKLLDQPSDALLLPSLILGLLAALSGVKILRVHDVKATKEVMDRLAMTLKKT